MYSVCIYKDINSRIFCMYIDICICCFSCMCLRLASGVVASMEEVPLCIASSHMKSAGLCCSVLQCAVVRCRV